MRSTALCTASTFAVLVDATMTLTGLGSREAEPLLGLLQRTEHADLLMGLPEGAKRGEHPREPECRRIGGHQRAPRHRTERRRGDGANVQAADGGHRRQLAQ